MTFARSLFLAIAAGILATVACLILQYAYKVATDSDFSLLIPWWKYLASCMVGCILASLGFFAIMKVMPKNGEIIFNFLFAALSFASIAMPIKYMEFNTENMSEQASWALGYVQVFAITLHFFPIISWFTLKPLFIKK